MYSSSDSDSCFLKHGNSYPSILHPMQRIPLGTKKCGPSMGLSTPRAQKSKNIKNIEKGFGSNGSVFVLDVAHLLHSFFILSLAGDTEHRFDLY